MDPSAIVAALVGLDVERRRHVQVVPATPGIRARDLALGPRLDAALARLHIEGLWAHQADGFESVRAGTHTIMATGTASGKSLVYQLATLAAWHADPQATALHLFPTKALAQDQVSRFRAIAGPEPKAAVYDGDTSQEERRWIRQQANVVISNPDMLHAGILAQHQRWAGFFRMLQIVVVDEAHQYRGVFGAHIAATIRRLRRICRRYGSDPVFVFASATVSNPAEHAAALLGEPVVAFVDDASAHGERTIVCWEPPILDPEAAVPRRSAIAETGVLLADLVDRGCATLAFTRARRAAEVVAQIARERLDDSSSLIASYRAGYLSEDRRALERALHDGTLRGVAATTALELGIDVGGLDAVIVAGFPGTRAAFRQQIGRAGRGTEPSLAIFVADEDPLDQYLLANPEALLDAPNEACITDPSNPAVMTPHLVCAAVEAPLEPADAAIFGPGYDAAVATLLAAGTLVDRGTRMTYAGRGEPHRAMGLRSAGPSIQIVETDTGRLLGSASLGQAVRGLHTGAMYLHQGEQYEVQALDLEEGIAFVIASDAPWTTHARATSDVRITSTDNERALGSATVRLGQVTATTQVVSYARRRVGTGELLDEHPLTLPEATLDTVGVWWEVDAVLGQAGIGPADLPGAIHAAEHAAIGVLPAIAMCDRWDVGGLSTPLHPDTGVATVIIYDGASGGAGFAARSFELIEEHLSIARTAIDHCRCPSGCPSCVQSPKCGNANEPLDKTAALRLLDAMLDPR